MSKRSEEAALKAYPIVIYGLFVCPNWNQRPRPTQAGCCFFGRGQESRNLLQKVRLRRLRVLTSPS